MANPKHIGAFLKPGQKAEKPEKPTAITRRSSTPKLSRYDELKEQVRHDRLRIGDALREIRDDKLYLGEYETFEEFCMGEFTLSRNYAYRLIEASAVKESIKGVLPIGNIGSGNTLTTESQARALAPVPEDKRAEVLEKAAKAGKVTAKSITEAAEKLAPKEPEPLTDKVGQVIPEDLIDEWQRADQTGRRLRTMAREIKVTLEKGFSGAKQEKLKDSIYAELGNSIISDAEALAWSLTSIIPHALCTSCQARNRKNCTLCRRRGWISRYLWNSPAVSKETRAIIERKNPNAT